MISEPVCPAINILLLHPREGGKVWVGEARRERVHRGCLSAFKFQVSPLAARIKLTLQQATTYALDYPIHPLRTLSSCEEGWWYGVGDDASPSRHISHTLLHFLNMTRRVLTSTIHSVPHPPSLPYCASCRRGEPGVGGGYHSICKISRAAEAK